MQRRATPHENHFRVCPCGQSKTLSNRTCLLSMQQRRSLAEDVHGHAAAARACAVKFRITWFHNVPTSRTDKFAAGVWRHAAKSVGRDAVGAMDLGIRFHKGAVWQ